MGSEESQRIGDDRRLTRSFRKSSGWVGKHKTPGKHHCSSGASLALRSFALFPLTVIISSGGVAGYHLRQQGLEGIVPVLVIAMDEPSRKGRPQAKWLPTKRSRFPFPENDIIGPYQAPRKRPEPQRSLASFEPLYEAKKGPVGPACISTSRNLQGGGPLNGLDAQGDRQSGWPN